MVSADPRQEYSRLLPPGFRPQKWEFSRKPGGARRLFLSRGGEEVMQPAADQVNQQMVDRLIAEGALWSPPLIAAFRATPRHRFLDRVFQYQRKSNRWREVLTRDLTAEELRIVYSDRALITHLSPAGRQGPQLPISSSSQPSLM